MNDEEFNLDGYLPIHFTPHSMLRERRVILGMTQKAVAEQAKIPLQSYQRFENGTRNILTASFQMTCRVLEVLQMDIAKFYHGDYTFGEPVYSSPEGLRYKKTGKLKEEDVTE